MYVLKIWTYTLLQSNKMYVANKINAISFIQVAAYSKMIKDYKAIYEVVVFWRPLKLLFYTEAIYQRDNMAGILLRLKGRRLKSLDKIIAPSTNI